MPVHVFETMGTAASLRLPDDVEWPGISSRGILEEIEAAFSSRENRFSLYRLDSEISRIARGDELLTASTEEFRASYAHALRWRSRTNDAFTPHRPDGVIDLSGIVKAEAMAAAEELLDKAGCADWLLNVGGDLLSHGRNGAMAWNVGIVDPEDRSELLCTVDLSGSPAALATSGTAERGEHVWRSDRRSTYVQVTVRACDIVTADVLATAILSGGKATRDEMLGLYDTRIDVLTVDARSELTATPAIAMAAGFTAA